MSGASTRDQIDGVVRILAPAIHSMIDQANRAAPHECCGLLLGLNGVIIEARQTGNVAADPLRHFEIEPQALVDSYRDARRGGPDVMGYFHSHPNGLAAPSRTDQASAANDGQIWAIIASGDVTFWRDGNTGFERLSYVRPDR